MKTVLQSRIDNDAVIRDRIFRIGGYETVWFELRVSVRIQVYNQILVAIRECLYEEYKI